MEDITAIAEKVAEILEPQHFDGRLLTTKELCNARGLSKDWVYSHATELGAIRLSSGPKAQMRFDLGKADAYLATLSLLPTQEHAPQTARKRKPKRRRKTATTTPYGVPRLTVKAR